MTLVGVGLLIVGGLTIWRSVAHELWGSLPTLSRWPWPGLSPAGAVVLLGCALLLAGGQLVVGDPRAALPRPAAARGTGGMSAGAGDAARRRARGGLGGVWRVSVAAHPAEPGRPDDRAAAAAAGARAGVRRERVVALGRSRQPQTSLARRPVGVAATARRDAWRDAALYAGGGGGGRWAPVAFVGGGGCGGCGLRRGARADRAAVRGAPRRRSRRVVGRQSVAGRRPGYAWAARSLGLAASGRGTAA